MNPMRILFFLALMGLGRGTVKAQLGLSADLSDLRLTEWESIAGDNAFDPAVQFSVNYWFALKKYRLDFLPTVFFLQGDTPEFFQEPGYELDYYYIAPTVRRYGFGVQARVYPLDWEGDCNCPTFSKRGKLVEKGFYLYLMPKIFWWQLSLEHGYAPGQQVPEDPASYNEWQVSAGLEGGIGLDIGLSDLITLSPYVGYEMATQAEWNLIFCNRCSLEPQRVRPGIIRAGIQLGLRWTK